MAATRASKTEEWENFFEELLRLMTDYETFYYSTNSILRENIVIRMESALPALQLVKTLAIERRLDCASVLREFSTTFAFCFRIDKSAISICSRQFQFAGDNFNLFAAISIGSRQF